MVESLIERLRAYPRDKNGNFDILAYTLDGNEAADHIEAAEATIARLSEALTLAKGVLTLHHQAGVIVVASNTWRTIDAALSGSGSGWQVPDGPVPVHECDFHIGQPVRLAKPWPEQDPSTVYYVTGIRWEHRAVPHRGWDIAIATAEELERGYGQTDGFAPSDLLPAAPQPTGGE